MVKYSKLLTKHVSITHGTQKQLTIPKQKMDFIQASEPEGINAKQGLLQENTANRYAGYLQ
jgi:hypothetical protein